MISLPYRKLFAGMLLAVLWLPVSRAEEPQSPGDVTAGIVEAAHNLLETLSDEQKQELLFDFDDPVQRHLWSNLPVGMFERRGLRMGDLNDQQREAVHSLIQSTLSDEGYEIIIENLQAEEVLGRESNNPRFSTDQFFLSFIGTPSSSTPWIWQFGGHHLAINATIVSDQVTLSPSLTGGQPMHYVWEGRTIRQMDDEVELAFELIRSLDETQREKAILRPVHVDLAFGPTVRTIRPRQEGIQADQLTPRQQQTLLQLIEKRVGMLKQAHAHITMQRIREELPETFVAWFGPTEVNTAATYRIQGPSLILEYSPQRLGGDATNHVHAIYRDPTNEYGERFLQSRQ